MEREGAKDRDGAGEGRGREREEGEGERERAREGERERERERERENKRGLRLVRPSHLHLTSLTTDQGEAGQTITPPSDQPDH